MTDLSSTPSAGRVVRPVEFPPSITDGTPTNWRRRIGTAVAVLVVVAVVGGVVLARVAGSSTVQYRTALVGDHDVESVLTEVGSIEPVSQATVAFPTSGTVATVDVAVGDTVATGQTLASIDTEALTATLHDKQATLASAQLALAKALASSSSSTSSSSGATTTTTTAAGSSPARSGTGTTAAQQAVVAGQRQVDTAMAAADQALAASAQVCSAEALASTTSTSSSSTATTTSDPVTTCQAALAAVSRAQAAVAAAQTSLAAASTALDAQLAQSASSSTSSSPTTPASTSSSGGADRSGSGGSGGATTGGSSASDLIADQKAIDAAEAAVAVAQQSLDQAAIVSPISGTVAAVTLTVGESVTAASTTASVIVVGAGGLEVTTAVSVDRIPDVKVGQAATVLPDGATDPISGQVVAIALTPATSTRGTTYRVTIGLDGDGAGLGNGATGTVAITTAGVTSVLSVPTSAVKTDGTNHTVTVVDGSTTSTVDVKVGVIGATWTQITDGLSAGQSVALANLDQALPGSATSSSNGRTPTNVPAGAFFGPGGPQGVPPGGR